MKEVSAINNCENCAANQVMYNLENREIEVGLLPLHQTSNLLHQTAAMAYSPVGHGRGLLENGTLKKIARRRASTPGQLALAWVLRQPGVIAIPKASNEIHVRETARSLD